MNKDLEISATDIAATEESADRWPWPDPVPFRVEGIYTVDEAAQILRIGKTKAWELIHARQIGAIRLGDAPGSKVIVRGTSILEFLDRNVY